MKEWSLQLPAEMQRDWADGNLDDELQQTALAVLCWKHTCPALGPAYLSGWDGIFFCFGWCNVRQPFGGVCGELVTRR